MTQSTAPQRQTGRSQSIRPSADVARNLAQAESLCRANRVRLTPIRRRVLEALHNAGRPLGAYDLADTLSSRGRRIAPITVYRALDFLIEQGLAHRLASLNAYIASSEAAKGHSAKAFLICESCGTVSEASSPELSGALSELHRTHAFAPYSGVLELSGRCAHC